MLLGALCAQDYRKKPRACVPGDSNGGAQTIEYINLKNWCSRRLIRLKYIAPARHGELNSELERLIQTLRVMARIGLEGAKLTPKFWGCALSYAVFLKNRHPHKGIIVIRSRSAYLQIFWWHLLQRNAIISGASAVEKIKDDWNAESLR